MNKIIKKTYSILTNVLFIGILLMKRKEEVSTSHPIAISFG